MGKPSIVKFWEGTIHINIGGNCEFLYEDSEEELKSFLERIIYDEAIYNHSFFNAQKKDSKKFLYSEIAKRSIEGTVSS